MSERLLVRGGYAVGIALLICCLLIGGLLFSSRRKAVSGFRQLTTEDAGPSPSPLQALSRVYIHTNPSQAGAKPGYPWIFSFTTNASATCHFDLFDPQKRQFLSAKEIPLSNVGAAGEWEGHVEWPVPVDAPTGDWSLRIICGSLENRAIATVSVSVRGGS